MEALEPDQCWNWIEVFNHAHGSEWKRTVTTAAQILAAVATARHLAMEITSVSLAQLLVAAIPVRTCF